MNTREALEAMKQAIRNDSLYRKKALSIFETTAVDKELHGLALAGDRIAHAWLMRRWIDRFESWDLATLLDFVKLAKTGHPAFDKRLNLVSYLDQIILDKKRAGGAI